MRWSGSVAEIDSFLIFGNLGVVKVEKQKR